MTALLAAATLSSSSLACSLRSQESHQPVLNLLAGLEHELLVGDRQLLEIGVLGADIVHDPAVVQQVPLKRRTDTAVERRVLEQIGEVLG